MSRGGECRKEKRGVSRNEGEGSAGREGRRRGRPGRGEEEGRGRGRAGRKVGGEDWEREVLSFVFVFPLTGGKRE